MRVKVIEEIEVLGKKMAPGRLIRTTTPEKFIEKYGQKVVIWHNWPQPMEEELLSPNQEVAAAAWGLDDLSKNEEE